MTVAKAINSAQQTTRNGQAVMTTSNGHAKKTKNLNESIEQVTAYQSNLRQAVIWQDRDESTARVRALAVWRCKVCDVYFNNLKKAEKHGKHIDDL